MNRLIVTLCLSMACFVGSMHAQNTRHEYYFPNIVNMEGTFGLLVGSQDSEYFFVTATRVTDATPADSRNVYFYQQPKPYRASFLKSFKIKDATILLYSAKLDKTIPYRKLYYQGYASADNEFYTFFKDPQSLSNWYTNSTPFEKNTGYETGSLQLKTSGPSYFSRGMPVVDKFNNLVAIVSDQPDELQQSPILWTVDMAAIEKELYAFSECKHFQLVEFGKSANRCELKENEKRRKIEAQKKLSKGEKMHKVAIAPSVSMGLLAETSSENSNSSFEWGGTELKAGLMIWTNPDQKRFRVSFFPNIAMVRMDAPVDLRVQSNGFKVVNYSWLHYEVPIHAEFVFDRNTREVWYWGIGYIPFYRQRMDIAYTLTNMEGTQKMASMMGSLVGHKFGGLFGSEWGKLKFNAFAQFQITPWYDQMADAGNTYYPYGNDPKHMGLRIGFSVGYRINGKSGLKVKSE
jgi:hypothetical protein